MHVLLIYCEDRDLMEGDTNIYFCCSYRKLNLYSGGRLFGKNSGKQVQENTNMSVLTDNWVPTYFLVILTHAASGK